jgi:hypothetical protein
MTMAMAPRFSADYQERKKRNRRRANANATTEGPKKAIASAFGSD